MALGFDLSMGFREVNLTRIGMMVINIENDHG